VSPLVPVAPLVAALSDPFDHPVADVVRPAGEPTAAPPLLSMMGVPFDTTTMGRRGSKHGPSGIRQALAGLLSYHGGFGVDLADGGPIADFGDVDVVETDVEETWARISAAARALAAEGRPLAVLGGDHGLTFPALRGALEARPQTVALVSLDAHYDVRPSHRGQPASGVPFRYALERLDGRVLPAASTQIGIAGWENSGAAAAYLADAGVRTFAARDVHRGGLEPVLEETMSRAAAAEGLWLTLDIDAVDVAYAPGTNAPTVGGLSSDQFLETIWRLARDPRLIGVDIVEVSPPLDVAGATQLLAAQALLTALAARHAA
jgi:formimidoylglutamase